MKGNILISDIDKPFLESLKYTLEQDRYKVEEAKTANQLIEKLRVKEYEMIIISLEHPGIDGLDLVKRIRETTYNPLIVVTNEDHKLVKILSLEYGADDILVKPINMQELSARIKAIIRREKYKNVSVDNHILQIRDIVINSLRRKIIIENIEIDLTGKEFDLFYVLSIHPGKVFTREELLEKVWGYKYFGDIRTVDVHVRRVREKIERKIKDTQYIMTKWGVGYYFNNI